MRHLALAARLFPLVACGGSVDKGDPQGLAEAATLTFLVGGGCSKGLGGLGSMIGRYVLTAAVALGLACSNEAAQAPPSSVEYENPVIATDCPDPGVLHDGATYVLTCTSGDDADAYPIYTSSDVVSWTRVGHVFPRGRWPSWAKGDFWAPEIHVVAGRYVVYFSARGADGVLAIGAASASSPLGPFVDIGHPLVHDASMGLIDASEITVDGQPYALFKRDGNAKAEPTPIEIQPLASDGLSLAPGSKAKALITNDEVWEGAVTEAPFMVFESGAYYLFYSGGSYADGTYAVGVARADKPTGPFTKLGSPIVSTHGAWVGPGHCSVVDEPSGGTAMVYHAWRRGCVNAPGCGREDLVDRVVWADGWPSLPGAPSSTRRALDEGP